MALTAAITIKDAEGNTIFSKSSLAASSSNVYFVDANNEALQIPLSGAHTVDCAISGGSPTTQQTIGVKLLIEK